MNTINRILLTATLAMTSALASQTRVQAQSTDDGVAASPKVRATLNERKATATAVPTEALKSQATTEPIQLAASPKLRQMLNDRKADSAVASTPAIVIPYASGGGRDIAASPKLREQLARRQMQFQIAPVR